MLKVKNFVYILLIIAFISSCKNNNSPDNVLLDIDIYQDSILTNRELLKPGFLNDDQIKRLEILCTIWGFLKYYHPEVNTGKYNWDHQLFHLTALVIQASSIRDANRMIARWIDELAPQSSLAYTDKIVLPANKLIAGPNYGGIFKNKDISNDIKRKLTHLKNIPIKYPSAFYVKSLPTGAPSFINEPVDYNIANVSVRLLALFRYWNIIEYFYPYRYLIKDWNGILTTYIPEFIKATSKAKYTLTFLKLMATVNDTHANIWGDNLTLDTLRGLYATPFKTEFIGNKLAITGYYKDTSGIRKKVYMGDIIEKINGTPVDSLLQKYLPLSPASNYTEKLAIMAHPNFGWLCRSSRASIDVEIRRRDSLVNVRIKMMPYKYAFFSSYSAHEGPREKIRIFKDSIGYISGSNINDRDYDSIYNRLKGTKRLIIDLRKYPGAYMPYRYAEWLKKEKSPFVKISKFYYPLPGYFFADPPNLNGGKQWKWDETKKVPYGGKIIIIVNSSTLSQGEFTAMAFRSIPHSIVIGNQTAGADGDVTPIPLPGGIRSIISGTGIYYPGGAETQRVGIKIDSVIYPTIDGIKRGSDELLDKAIEIATE